MKSSRSADPRRASALSETARKEVIHEEKVKKSKSVTSSIGQAPSLVSSFSSNASDLTFTDSAADVSKCSDEGISAEESWSNGSGDMNKSKTSGSESCHTTSAELVDGPSGRVSSDCPHDERAEVKEKEFSDNELEHESHENTGKEVSSDCNDQEDMPPPPAEFGINNEDNLDSTASSPSGANDHDLPSEDLPPPPPEVYADIDDDHFEMDDDTLPPAPSDMLSARELQKMDEFYVSLNSDILELCGRKPMEECCCEDFQPKFDSSGNFFAL